MSHSTDRKQLKAKHKAERREKNGLALARIGSDILSTWQLLTVISAAYATYVVSAGTNGYIPKLMVAPLGISAAIVLIKKFKQANQSN